jgi:putative SOS response-associated peptidase YedK
MCGRVRATFLHEKAAEQLGARLQATLWTPSPNIAPTQRVLALLRDEKGLVVDALRWGLIPSWAKDSKIGSKMFNARAETVAEKPSFRSAFKSRRCAVLVDAFYEWADFGGARVPHAFCVEGRDVFPLAGLWESWRAPEGEVVRSCAVVTTSANEATRLIHDRMPVILPPEALDRWLDPQAPPEALHSLLKPFAGSLSIAPTRL